MHVCTWYLLPPLAIYNTTAISHDTDSLSNMMAFLHVRSSLSQMLMLVSLCIILCLSHKTSFEQLVLISIVQWGFHPLSFGKCAEKISSARTVD